MRFIVPSDKVYDGNITLLAVAVTAPDALFDTLRVPGQIVVDNSLAKLQVQAFCASLGTHQHLRARAELMYQGETHADLATRPDSRRNAGALFLLPSGGRLLRARPTVHAAQQRNACF